MEITASMIIAVISFIGVVAVTRYIVGELKKVQEAHAIRLDKHGDDLVELNTRSKLAVTAKDVDEKFVSKEMFAQLERHLNQRFDGIEKGQLRILEFVRKRKDD